MEKNINLPCTISGRVIEGSNRGLKLGFPTANLSVDSGMQLPNHGIYAGKVKMVTGTYKDRHMLAACSVGRNFTFDATKITVEVHLLDFNGDIHDQCLELTLIHYLRPMLRFDEISDLIRQIEKDIEKTRRLLKTQK